MNSRSAISKAVATSPIAQALLASAKHLSDQLDAFTKAGLFTKEPVTHVYNPLGYAWGAHQQFIQGFGSTSKRVVFLGMNPGPFGMMQTGVPFGEIAAVRDWIGIQSGVQAPEHQHAKRPIEGFSCKRAEVSGKRLWGWAADKFGSAERFFQHCFVLNYCPLVFLEASGKNFTPDKLPVAARNALHEACDEHLRQSLSVLQPDWAIGVGAYAMQRIEQACKGHDSFSALKIGQILHPSPASPAANRGWAQAVDQQMRALMPDLFY